jgi:transposase-like protein
LVHEEIGEILAGGVPPETNILSALVQLGVRHVVQQGLEQEQADFVGRDRYERGAGTKGRRNGYEDATLLTAEGGIGVRVPQVRDSEVPYHSKLIEFLAGNTEALDRLVVEMYARGLSTRDIEDALRGPDGELLLSRTAVSEITDRLWEDYQAFCARDLSQIDVAYLFCDAIFESLRRYGAKEAVLVCWCITTSGYKVLLHLAAGDKESEACWTEFFRHMISRGLRVPTSVTADGAPGLINAIGVCFPRSIRIRCWFHRMGNILAKVPEEAKARARRAHAGGARRRHAGVGSCGRNRSGEPVRRCLPRRDLLLHGGPGRAAGSPSPAGPPPHLLSDDKPHRAQLRGGASAHEGDPALHRRALGDEAGVRRTDPVLTAVEPSVDHRHRTSPAQAAAGRAQDRPAAEGGSKGGPLEKKEDGVTQVAAFTGASGLDHPRSCSLPSGAGRPTENRQIPYLDPRCAFLSGYGDGSPAAGRGGATPRRDWNRRPGAWKEKPAQSALPAETVLCPK